MKNKIFITAFIFMLFFSGGGNLYALPQIEEVVSGSAQIEYPDSATLTINAQDQTIINYSSFNINEGETVIVNLPSANSAILNRVSGTDLSRILGDLTSNGLFILVNENGIYVGPNANIDAGSLVLSTREISNSDFLKGDYLFKRLSQEQLDILLLNKGRINIREGGFGVLIAGAIENQGVISATLGKVVLAGGDAVRLDISDDGLISVAIEEKVASQILDHQGNPITDQIKNTGTLEANGGEVLLKAGALPGIFEKTINLAGFVRANRIENKDGIVRIVADGDVRLAAEIEANRIEIEADLIQATETIKADSIKLAAAEISLSASAPVLEFFKTGGDISIDQLITSGEMITIRGENVNLTYLSSANLTLRSNGAIDAIQGVIITASRLNLISDRFGAYNTPLTLNAGNIRLTRLNGDIQILESLGIGTSILLRGPPQDGFGAIIYNQDTNLTLTANAGSIYIAQDAGISANNLTLTANQDILSRGALLANETLSLLANGDISSLGALIADTLIEQGATFSIGGILNVRHSNIRNADRALTYVADTSVSGQITDDDDIIINANVTITLTGDTTFWADYDGGVGNGAGAFTMNSGSSIVGGGYDLTLYASEASTLRSITGVGTLTINESYSSSNPVYTANNTYTVGALTVDSGTLILGGALVVSNNLTINTGGTLDVSVSNYKITVGNRWYEYGTFEERSGTVDFNGASGIQYILIDATFNNVDHTGAGTLDVYTGGTTTTVNGTLTQSAGTLTASYGNITANNLTVSGGTFSPGGTVTITGTYSVTGGTVDWTTNTGTLKYQTDTSQTIPALDTTFYNLTIDDNGGGASVITLPADIVVNGTLTINTGGTLDVSVSNYKITVGKHWSEYGTFTERSGTVDFNGASGIQYIEYSATTFNNLNHTGAGTLNVFNNGPATVNGTLTQSAGTLTGGGNITANNLTVSGGTFSPGGTVTITDTYAVTGGTVDWVTNTGTLKYQTDTSQTIPALDTTFYNLTIDDNGGATSVITLPADIVVNNNLTIETGGTLDVTANNYKITVGKWWYEYGTFEERSGTVDFNRASGIQYILTDATFNNLTHTGAGTLDVYNNNATTVNGTLTQSAGTLTGGGNITANNLTVSGGTFSPGGTVTITDTYAVTGGTVDWVTNTGTLKYQTDTSQTIPALDTTFYNLTIDDNGGAASVITLPADIVVNNNLTINTGGTLDVTANNYKITVGKWWYEYGTFEERSGTVDFNRASGIQYILTDATFNNLTHTGAGTLSVYYGGTTTIVNGTLTQSAGILTGGGNITANNFTVSGGTFTAPGGTTTINGALSVTGGTFDANDKALAGNITSSTNTTIGAGGTYQTGTGTYTLYNVANSGNLIVEGAISNITFTTLTNNSGSTVTYSSNTSGPGALKNVTYDSLTLNTSGYTFNLSADTTVNNNLTVTAGALDVTANNYTLNVGGNWEISGSGVFTPNSGRVVFDAADTDNTITTSSSGADDFYDLKFNNASGKWTLQDSLTVNNDLAITAGTLDLGSSGYTLELAGAGAPLSVTGTLTPGTSTVRYTGTGSAVNIAATTYNSLHLAPTSAATYSLTGNLTGTNALTGNLTIDSNAALDVTASNYNITLTGNWSNSGTFTARAGTVTFDGADRTVSGSTTFYNLTRAASSSITFARGSTQTIAGKLTLKGAGSGDKLILKSDANGQYWYINITSDDYDLDYLDVRDSYNLGVTIYVSNTAILTRSVGWQQQITEQEIEQATRITDTIDDTVDIIFEEDFQENISLVLNENGATAETKQGYGFDLGLIYEEAEKKYKKGYLSGKYRTVVIVFEGEVVVAPYDEKGAKYDQATVLTTGQKTSVAGDIR